MTAVRSAVLRHRDALIDATTATKICCHDCRFDLPSSPVTTPRHHNLQPRWTAKTRHRSIYTTPATTATTPRRHDLSPWPDATIRRHNCLHDRPPPENPYPRGRFTQRGITL